MNSKASEKEIMYHKYRIVIYRSYLNSISVSVSAVDKLFPTMSAKISPVF